MQPAHLGEFFAVFDTEGRCCLEGTQSQFYVLDEKDDGDGGGPMTLGSLPSVIHEQRREHERPSEGAQSLNEQAQGKSMVPRDPDDAPWSSTSPTHSPQ